MFNPEILVSFNGQENDILGDYFKGNEELTQGNIFLGKNQQLAKLNHCHFTGIDRQVFWEDGHLAVAFAASKIDNLTYAPSISLGLEARDFNYLGKFSYRTKMQIPLALMHSFHQKVVLLKVILEESIHMTILILV